MFSLLRRVLLEISTPVTKALGYLHAPWSRKEIGAATVRFIENPLKGIPGAILLSRTNGEFSNVLNPSWWTHGAIYIGYVNGVPSVIEAIGEGVVMRDLIDFCMTKDHICMLTPTFCDEGYMHAACRAAEELTGASYDTKFELGGKAFYCFEVQWYSYKVALGNDTNWNKRDVLGNPTVLGDDYLRAKGKWNVIYLRSNAWDKVKSKVLK
jgi:uncharacterized protein YycO